MAKLHLIYILSVLLIAVNMACTNNTIKIESPEELKTQPKAIAYINALANATNKLNTLTSKLIKITGGKDINSTSELSNSQTIKMAAIALQMMKVTKQIDELDVQRKSIDSLLNPQQIIALTKVCTTIKEQMMKIDTNALPLNTKGFIAEQKEQDLIKQKQKAHIDSITAIREEAIRIQKAEGTWDNYKKIKSNEIKDVPAIFSILFPLMVIGVFIFAGYLFIKRLRRKVRDISYTTGEIKNTTQKIIDNPELILDKKKDLSEIEKSELENLLHLFDKTTKK